MGLEVYGGQRGQGFLGAGLDPWAIMGQCLTSATWLRVMGPERNLGLPLGSPESASGLRGSAWWRSACCSFPRPAPLLPEGQSSGDPGGSLRAAGLPGRSFDSLNTPLVRAPGISEARGGSGQRLRNTGESWQWFKVRQPLSGSRESGVTHSAVWSRLALSETPS